MENTRTYVATKTRTQDVVLGELQAREQRPSDLLESLTNKGYRSLEIKQALAQLLDEARIELTDRRILRTR